MSCCTECTRGAPCIRGLSVVGFTPIPAVFGPADEDHYAAAVHARAASINAALASCPALPPDSLALWQAFLPGVDAWIAAKPGFFRPVGAEPAWWQAGQQIENQLDQWQAKATALCSFVPPAPVVPPPGPPGPLDTVSTIAVAGAVGLVALAAIMVFRK